MQKIKRPLSIILTILMLVTMIPFSSLTASAGYVQYVGGFAVIHATEGADYTYSDGVLTIISDHQIAIHNRDRSAPTTDRIFVKKDVSANIELMGVNIDTSNKGVPAFEIAEGSTGNVTITLGLDVGIGSVGSGAEVVERSKNYLKSGFKCAGFQKNGGETYKGLFDQEATKTGKLTIKGDGWLYATGGNGAAGIGGAYGKNTCNIEIQGGSVDAIATSEDFVVDGVCMGGAGIGGGSSNADISYGDFGGIGTNITISGGIVNAKGAESANAIGEGYMHRGDIGNCSNIVISGGYVTLTSGILAFCVGGNSNSHNKVTGGVVWFVPNGLFGVSTQSMSYSNCIIYDNKVGKVYGNYTLPWNHAVLAEHTLTIPKGSTLTVPAGVTLTNKGTITKEGNLVVNGSIVCDGHSFVNGVCTRCFNPCTHTKYSNGFCTGCGKVTNEITLNSNGYYEISNAGELYCFAEKSQSDKTINAILTADITVNEGTITDESTGVRSWTPIAYNYAGTFDGNGHSVSGLYLKSSESDQGFVRRLSDKGTVKNLTIKNSYISGGQYTGGITGDNSGTIDNCHISATVNGTKYVGGIVGDNGGIVTNCSSAGVVTGSEAYTGGIAGCHDDTVLTNCHNSATVSGDNTVGGVVGWCASTITKCSNSGKISATNSTVGGITGLAIIYDGAAVSYCSNTGDVTGSDFVGGIVGSGHDTPITNCYSTGKATFNENGPGQFTALGIIVGHNNSYNAAVNCYYLDTAITTGGIFNIDYKGHTESATLEQFKSGEIAYRLNGIGEKVWCQKIGTEELPQLKGSKVYYGYISCSATAEKKYTNTSTATATKPSHEAKTVANCLDLAVCKNCGETYGSKNPDNHKSTEIRSEYVDDTYHKDYHVCCDALIGSCTHSRSTVANCISKAYCNECKSYYGSINAGNHASEFTWVDNGYGTHSKKWNCCNLLENETKPHSFTITADDEKNVITARCNDCGYEDSLTLVVPEGELVYDGTSEYVYAKGYIHGIDSKREIYANGELYNGTWSDAGKYKQVLTVGGKSVSVEYEIKKKELTVRELWVAGKDFDGTRKMKVYDVYFEGLMPADDVEANCDNAYTYAPSNRAGDYTTVSGLTGVTVEGNDMRNYIIPEISEDVEYSADYSIYPYEVRIVPEHQYITDASKLDTTKFTIDTEIPEGYTIEGMAVALDGTEIIVVDDSNAKVMYGDEDFTDCFYFNTYATAAVVICCEGHKSDENGFCSTGTCSDFEAAKLGNNGTPDYDGDDCYEVSNAGQLLWFAKQVNGYGNQYANVKLTADIDLNPGYTFNSDGTYTGGNSPREWTPIGYADGYSPYTGMFDGNGHTISGMYVNTPDESFVGMFGGCDYGNTIKNLKLSNSYFSGRSYVGSLIGYAGTTVSGCYIDNTVTVKGNGYSVGGIVGELAYNAVKNCISFANVIDEDSELFVGKNYGEVINCYYSSNSTGTTRTDAEAKTEEEFASGEVAYLLQSGVEEEYIYDAEADDYIPVIPHIWGQKLGTDKYPVICGDKVYYGYKDCNATEKTYCNNNAYDEIPTHSFE
ncbi:MAG: hypothetical protein UE295_02900, partial [Acutalibacteraceae bacterium]|nr:hypothetical protein [Acutalibacteraceae bacterium]